MKRYDSYKDSGVEWIGEIPSHWFKSKVRYVTKEHRQGYYSSDSYSESGLKVVRITDLNDDRTISIQNSPFYALSDVEKERFLLSEGDFLFPRTGGVGRFGIFTDSTPSIYGSFLIRFRFNEEVLLRYMRYYFDSDFYLNQILSEIHGGVNQNVHVENIKDCILFFPNKNEQHQIVSYLDRKTEQIDSLIEKTRRKIELLKENRTSLINEAVTKGLNPHVEMKDSGVEWIGEIPSHWVRKKLNYLSEKIGDGLHSTPKYVDSSEYHFINGNNLVNGSIKIFESTKCVDEEEYLKHYIDLNENTLLLSINGTIGNLSFYNNEKVILGKSSCYINLMEDINRNFIYYVLLSSSVNKYFTFELTGTTIFNLSLNSIRNTPIVFPPLSEQHQIVSYLDKHTQLIDKTVSVEERRIELLKAYRQSLISEVVTGKRKVTTDEQEIQ
jgi:type I restriction enzyme S subunit